MGDIAPANTKNCGMTSILLGCAMIALAISLLITPYWMRRVIDFVFDGLLGAAFFMIAVALAIAALIAYLI
jgi:hypothetical protein